MLVPGSCCDKAGDVKAGDVEAADDKALEEV